MLLFMGIFTSSMCSTQLNESITSQVCELLQQQAHDLFLNKKYDEAITVYKQAIEQNPTHAELFFNLGQALYATKKYPEALEAYKKTIQYNNDHYNAYIQMAQLMIDVKQLDDAIKVLTMAFKLNQNNPQAQLLLVKVYNNIGKFHEAIDLIHKGLALKPDDINFTLALGDTYRAQNKSTEAIACYKKILDQKPDHTAALLYLGYCYSIAGDKDKAVAAFDNIIQKNPHHLEALYGKAFICQTFGDFDTAIEIYHYILAINPDHAHYSLAQYGLHISYVTQGNFELGWKHHELWFAKHPLNGNTLKSFLCTNDIADKKILLHSLGGLGDTLHFVRYAERLKNMGAHVILNCQKNLIPLLARCPYIDQLIGNGTSFPDYDAETELMIIPSIFGDNEETAPKNIPYLSADPDLVTHWQQKLAADTNFKVGICWQSVPGKGIPPIAHRKCPLQHFTRLGKIDGVSFYSLQKVDGIEQLATLSSDFPLHVFDNFDEQSGAFMDSAALIKNLDLIISVDTSVIHLAGGLGAKIWMLHPYSTDWRWIVNRTDSYWYPNLRIFKQQKPFDWEGVMENVAHELQKLISQQQTKGDI
jgi:tetratricopeptide (TPR) repeat protein